MSRRICRLASGHTVHHKLGVKLQVIRSYSFSAVNHSYIVTTYISCLHMFTVFGHLRYSLDAKSQRSWCRSHRALAPSTKKAPAQPALEAEVMPENSNRDRSYFKDRSALESVESVWVVRVSMLMLFYSFFPSKETLSRLYTHWFPGWEALPWDVLGAFWNFGRSFPLWRRGAKFFTTWKMPKNYGQAIANAL